jgi:hypothetical protein
MDNLKLEVGKSYINSYGDIIVLLSREWHMSNYVFLGDDGNEYNHLGNFISADVSSSFDLIQESLTTQPSSLTRN